MTTTDTTVWFEACAEFRPVADHFVCTCGWLDDDHVPAPAMVLAMRARPPRVAIPERRAS
jgi:hypothetical protein